MPTTPNFYDILFNHKKIVRTLSGQSPIEAAAWDCKMGIFSNGAVTHGGEAEKLIQGIMSACNLQDKWKVFPKGTNYQSVFNLKNLQFVLMFGISEKELNIDLQLPLYQALRFHNKIWIKAHSLEIIAKNPPYKKELWNNALKPLFIEK